MFKNSKQNHAVRHVRALKRILDFGISNEWITINPFDNYKAKTEQKDVIFLTENELKKLENITLNTSILDTTRDLFLFSCYTGLAYIELKNLSITDIKISNECIRS